MSGRPEGPDAGRRGDADRPDEPRTGDPRASDAHAGDPRASESGARERRPKSPWGGQCPRCRHVKLIESDRGSVFVMCRRAAEDPRLRKYPPQPQLVCRAFEPDAE